MFGADVLTFQEFMMREPLPLATVQQAVLEFLRGCDDVVVFGAQAVNAYVQEPRMTQDLDLLSNRAEEVAQALCAYLRQRFHIAVRIPRVAGGRGLRLFQMRKTGNRHLVRLATRGDVTVDTAHRWCTRDGTSRIDRKQGYRL